MKRTKTKPTAPDPAKALLALHRWWAGITEEIDAVAGKVRNPKGPLYAALGDAKAGATDNTLMGIVDTLDHNRQADVLLTAAELLAELKSLEGGVS